MPSALIVGITGQDGSYLAAHLLSLGYIVYGTSRDSSACNVSSLRRLGILERVQLLSLAPNDFRSVLKTLSQVQPDEVYHLAGQTSVGLSFEQPVECMESIAVSTLNILEVIRYLGLPTRIFAAGSSECFGDTGDVPATESTAFHPRSPYGVAKSTAYWQVANYREAYGLFCCTGILANHESPLRPQRFVTQKIIHGVKSIQAGQSNCLSLGNLDVLRDWGWAPDYVAAMHLMLQASSPKDYLIASGTTHSLRSFVDKVFGVAGLDSSAFLQTDDSLMRPSDIASSRLDPSAIHRDLGWRSHRTLDEIVRKMYFGELF